MLLIGFSEIGEDVDSLAFGGPFNAARHHIKDSYDLINYGLMANLMRGKTDPYFKM